MFKFVTFGALIATALCNASGAAQEMPDSLVRQSVEADTCRNGLDAKTLDELTVEGKAVRMVDGNFLFSPPASVVKSSDYAIDLVGKLGVPGITYNPLNRTLTSTNGTPAILINGVPASQEELKNIRASEVLNVEYSNFVPSKFLELGNVLINVRLKEHSNGGMVNLWEMNDFIGSSVNTNDAVAFYQGPSKWVMDYYLDYRDMKECYFHTRSEYLSPQLPVSISRSSHAPFSYRKHNARLQYIYAPSSSLLFMARYRLQLFNDHRKYFSDIEDSYRGFYTEDMRTRTDNVSNNLNLYFSKSLNNSNSIDANIDLNHSTSDYDSRTLFNLKPEPAEYSNIVNSSRYALLGVLSYTHTFHDSSSLSATYDMTLSSTKNRYFITGNDYLLKETNQSLYADYRRWLVKDKLWLFARTGLKINRVRETAISSPRSFIRNMSNLYLSWNVANNWMLDASGWYNSSTLLLSLLQDNLVQTSPYLYNIGNPDLKPSTLSGASITGMFSKGKIQLSSQIQYNHINSSIQNLVLYDSQLKAYLSRPENMKFDRSVDVSLSCNLNDILNMFSVSGQINYRHQQLATQSNWKNITNGVYGDFTLAWNYKKWQICYSRNFPSLIGNGLGRAYSGQSYDVIWGRFRPDGHWTFTLQYSYMFSKKGWIHKSEIYSPQYINFSQQEIHESANMVSLSIAYNFSFGSPFKGKERNRKFDVTDSQSTYTDYAR